MFKMVEWHQNNQRLHKTHNLNYRNLVVALAITQKFRSKECLSTQAVPRAGALLAEWSLKS